MAQLPKHFLQKVSKVIAMISFITAIASGIYLVTLTGDEDKVLKSSMGALAFFCFTVGLVLNTMATTNLPNLKVPRDGKQLNEEPEESFLHIKDKSP